MMGDWAGGAVAWPAAGAGAVRAPELCPGATALRLPMPIATAHLVHCGRIEWALHDSLLGGILCPLGYA